MQELQRGVLDLVKACLTQEKADIGSEFDWDAAYEIGYNHGILPMLYYGVPRSIPELKQSGKAHIYAALWLSDKTTRYYLKPTGGSVFCLLWGFRRHKWNEATLFPEVDKIANYLRNSRI